jgi:hypothetical protein
MILSALLQKGVGAISLLVDKRQCKSHHHRVHLPSLRLILSISSRGSGPWFTINLFFVEMDREKMEFQSAVWIDGSASGIRKVLVLMQNEMYGIIW